MSDSYEQKWKTEAKELQQSYYELLGDRGWDKVDRGDWTTLRQKVGFGVYGPPLAVPTCVNKNTGYDDKQLEHIEMICKKLSKYNDGVDKADTYLACIFVTGKILDDRFTIPVFKTKSKQTRSTTYFLDTDCRVYSSWGDYLNKNKLPKCIYCYPHGGVYSGDDEVHVDFGTSPACDLVNRIFSICDVVYTVVTIGAAAVGVSALCNIPIARPLAATAAIAGASSETYAVGRSGYTLYDRGTHDQSIGLTDKEALACWLSIVGSSLCFVQWRTLSSMATTARAGDVIGKVGRIAFAVGCVTVNSVRIFLKSVRNFKTASTIIEVQRDTINQHKNGFSRNAEKLLNKHIGKLRGRDEMHGNARVIKILNRIVHKQQLYEMMVSCGVDSRKVKLTPEGYKGLLNVNNDFKVHPSKFMEMHPDSRQQIMNATQQLKNLQVSLQDFKKQMTNICKEYRIRFECMRKETIDNLCKAYGKDNVNHIVINNRRLFADMKPHEIDRVSVVLGNAGKNYDSKILSLATKFAQSRDCKTVSDFCSYMEFSSLYIVEIKRELETEYQQKLSEARGLRNFKQAQFDKNYGIEGKRPACFEQKVLNTSISSEGIQEMNTFFDKWKRVVGDANRHANLRFCSDNAATYHYLKHRRFGPSGLLTVDQYFKLASDVFSNPKNQKSTMLSQEGNCTFITYMSPINGAFCVKIDRIQDGNCVSSIATVMHVQPGTTK